MLLNAQVTAWSWEVEEQSVAGKEVGEEGDQDGGIQGNFGHSSMHNFDHVEGANVGLKYPAFSSLYWW